MTSIWTGLNTNFGDYQVLELNIIDKEKIKSANFIIIAGVLGESLGSNSSLKMEFQKDPIISRIFIQVYIEIIKAYEDCIKKKRNIF